MRRIAIVSVVFAALATLAPAVAHADTSYRPPEYGYQYGEVEQPRTMALGGAARAMGWSTSAIPSNPANVAAQHVYHFEALVGSDTKAHKLTLGAAVMDSITSRLALGVLATHTGQGTDADTYRRTSLDVRVAAAYPLSDRVAFGVTGHYLRATQDGTGALGESPISKSSADDPTFRTLTMDAGLAFSLSSSVRIGAVGYNLTSTQNALAPLMLGGGIGVKAGDLVTIEGNAVGVDKTTWGAWKTRAQGGLEVLLAERYPIRVGYQWDEGSKRHAVSGGVGYVDPTFAIDASFRQDVVAPSDDPWAKAFRFVISVRYFYNAGGQPADVGESQGSF